MRQLDMPELLRPALFQASAHDEYGHGAPADELVRQTDEFTPEQREGHHETTRRATPGC